MASKWTWIGLALGAILLAGGAWSQMSTVEEPKFTIAEQANGFELRDYPAMIAAEVSVKGPRETAINDGFRLLADYIFGNNIAADKVAMTAPVTQQASESVAMTAPVTQSGAGDSWTVQFIMPSKYTMETLPKPKNPAVVLKPMEPERFAVIRFSGVGNDALLEEKTAELTKMIEARKLSAIGPVRYAFYNPPWVLGMFRRNEVMVPVAR
jgi:hypothetical protein